MGASAPSPLSVLRLAALGTWLAVGLPIALRLLKPETRAGAPAAVAAWLFFGLCFFVLERCGPDLSRRRALALLAGQTAAAVALAATDGSGLQVALLVMIAASLLEVVPWPVALIWVAGQTAVSAAALVWRGAPLLTAIVVAGAMLGFQAFALGVVHLAHSEARARAELARLNEELRAAQARLSENARLAERLRIARELHDVLGHHLTALSLNLEIAGHVSADRAAPHVATAHGLTRLLLAEVRDVVSALREDAPVDLADTLRALAASVPAPAVHLRLPDALGAAVIGPEAAHACLRCVQEIVTNAVRHAQAKNLWIDVEAEAGELRVRARDDGRGAAEVRPGNGLRGMRERLERAGGRLEVSAADGQGFALTAVWPLAARGAA